MADNKFRESIRESTTPDFLDGGRSGLVNAENEAADAGGFYNNGAGVAGVEEIESNVPQVVDSEELGLYSGSGRAVENESKGKLTGKFEQKKAGIFVGILLAIFGVGAVFGGMQSFQLFAWAANIQQLFGQSSTVLSVRFDRVFRDMLNSNSNNTSETIFGSKKYDIPKSLERKLNQSGITIEELKGSDGGDVRVLAYTDSNGNKVVAAGSTENAGRLAGVDGAIRVTTLDRLAVDAPEFKRSFDTATITLTGRVAGWWDSLSDLVLRRIGGENARSKLSGGGDDLDEEKLKEKLYRNAVDDDVSVESSRAETDGNGNTDERSDDDVLLMNTDEDGVRAKLETIANKAAVGSSAACMAIRSFGAINSMAAGIKIANTVDFALKVLNAVDQTKAGDGNGSYNAVANLLNTRTKATAYDIDGNEYIYSGATTESKGWNEAFSDKSIISSKDPGALMVSREGVLATALKKLRGNSDFLSELGEGITSIDAYKNCLGVQAIGGAVDFASDVFLLITTAGIGNAVKTFVSGIFDSTATATAIGMMVVAISVLAPSIAQWLAGDLSGLLQGEVGGYALGSAAHFLFNANLQMSTGMNANLDQALQLYALSKDKEKEWIAYERETLSPFDITNRNTFMGSIAYSMMPIINRLSASPASSVPASLGLLSDSLVSLSGRTVSAASDINDFRLSLYSEGSCPKLEDVGVAGDAYCNKYSGAYVDDLKQIGSYELYEELASRGSFDGTMSDGNPIIKKDSDYAKYIVACNLNDAQPGEVSATVVGFVGGLMNEAGPIANAVLNFVPGASILDVIESAEDASNMQWNTQEACSKEEYRYFSDYSVDQRVLEDMGLIEKSAVTAFVDEYYEENPLDDTYEGRIARLSGMTTEQVNDTIAVIDYINYIASYDASTRYAFGTEVEVVTSDDAVFDSENVMSGEMVALNNILYADIRNRNFAV